MRKTYTALALMFAVATAWAQVPLSQVMKSGAQYRTHLSRTTADMLELQTVNNNGVSKARRADTTLPTVADLITEQPQGTLYKAMYRTCSAYYPNDYGLVTENSFDGYATDVVVSTDGTKIYVKNPYINLNTDTWLVGSLDAEGNVEFNFPQAIYHNTSSAGVVLGYAWKMTQTATDQGTAVTRDESSQTVKFKWVGNTLTQVNANEVIGMGNENGEWYGYGIFGSTFAEQTDVVMKPADETKAEEWRISYTSAANSSKEKETVRVIVDGNRVYVGDVYKKDFWILGLISGDKVVFPAQYLGLDDDVHDYMLPLELKTENGKTMAYVLDNLTFSYDAAAKKMTTDYVLGINVGKNKTQLWDGFMQPVIEKVAYVAGTPATPKIYYVIGYNTNPQLPDVGGFEYILSNLSVDGSELNENNIFYNIYLDDQLLTFDKATYKYIEEDMTNLPYGYTDSYYSSMTQQSGYDIYAVKDNGVTYQDVFLFKDFNKIGVKALYIDGDKTYESDMAEYTVSGINNTGIDEGANVKSVSYTDLSGRKVSAPVHGAYLQTVTYDNGQTKTVKVMK